MTRRGRAAAAAAMVAVAVAGAGRVEADGRCRPPAAGARLVVDVPPDASLAAVGAWLERATCKRVRFERSVPAAAVSVSLLVPGPVTPAQAVGLFAAAATAGGYVATERGDAISVAPGPGAPRGCVGPAVPAAAGGGAPGSAADLDAQIAKAVRAIDATHYVIDARAAAQLFQNPEVLARSARIVPVVRGGNVQGFKLYGVRPGSLFARLGLANGDVLVSVDGRALSSVDSAREVYARARVASALAVEVQRRGTPVTISIEIR